MFCVLQLVLHARSVRCLSVCCIPKPLLFCTSAIWHLAYLAPLLFGTSSVWHLSYLAFRRFCIDRLTSSVSHFRCVLDCHTSVFLVLFFVLYIVIVLRARSVRRLLVCCIPKPLLFGKSPIWRLCYSAPFLFDTSPIWLFVGLYRWTCSICHFWCVLDCHTSVFHLLIFVLYIVVSAAR